MPQIGHHHVVPSLTSGPGPPALQPSSPPSHPPTNPGHPGVCFVAALGTVWCPSGVTGRLPYWTGRLAVPVPAGLPSETACVRPGASCHSSHLGAHLPSTCHPSYLSSGISHLSISFCSFLVFNSPPTKSIFSSLSKLKLFRLHRLFSAPFPDSARPSRFGPQQPLSLSHFLSPLLPTKTPLTLNLDSRLQDPLTPLFDIKPLAFSIPVKPKANNHRLLQLYSTSPRFCETSYFFAHPPATVTEPAAYNALLCIFISSPTTSHHRIFRNFTAVTATRQFFSSLWRYGSSGLSCTLNTRHQPKNRLDEGNPLINRRHVFARRCPVGRLLFPRLHTMLQSPSPTKGQGPGEEGEGRQGQVGDGTARLVPASLTIQHEPILAGGNQHGSELAKKIHKQEFQSTGVN